MRFIGNTLLVATLTLMLAGAAAADLKDYVTRADDSYHFELDGTEQAGSNTLYFVHMTSQTWQGIEWTHWLTIIRPQEVLHPDAAMLFVTGGDMSDGRPSKDSGEVRILGQVAQNTKSVVAFLHQVPNQPLFDGLTEDGIIALTYEKYLDGEGEDWPLLFPMVKSAVRAMDTIESVMAEKHDQDIKRFFVTGGSKRGWTTWLSAVADDRVEYIAPLIIDMLNAVPQMQHQLAVYGGFSTQIEDYTQRNLQQRMASAEGQKLNSMVDPYSYRDELTLPKLIVLGANDPYWTVDAANFYYDDLKGPKRLYYQANTGHDVGLQGVATVTEFYNSMLTGQPFPELKWSKQDDGSLVVTWEKAGGTAKLWQARSSNRDFRDARWTSTPVEGEGRVEVAPPAVDEGWVAWYVEVNWTGSFGMPFGLTSQMNVTPDTLPEAGIRTYDKDTHAALQSE
ncbi:MAG: hypothetical protein IT368_18735 [Candidatus Hydrogenedentes bacterium]|nr:hypothetical protein [Candidatus Hydrogenedentota bacterium]